MIDNICEIVVKDVLEELNEENKRLFNQLLFADKCLKVLIEFKTFVELNSNRFKLNLEENNKQKYEELSEKVKEVLDEKSNYRKNFNEFQQLVQVMREGINFRNNQRVVKTLKKSRKFKRNNGQYVCHYLNCGQRFDNKRDIKNHRNRHYIQVKRFVCDFPGCNVAFSTKWRVEAHKTLRHTQERPFECQTCGKAYASDQSLKAHIKYSHTDIAEPVVCGFDGCNRRFKNDFCLKSHQNMCHILKFECDYPNCDYKIGSKSQLNKHKIENHTNERPFKCQYEGCDKAFKFQRQYENHIKTHSTTLLTCPHEGCDRTYNIENSLQQHIKIDHSDTWYSCEWPGCDYKTKAKPHLTRHKLNHSDEYTVACIWPNCDKKFKAKQNMKNHLLTHKQEKKQICPLPGCDYRCITLSNLKVHKKNRHKDV